MVSLVIEDGVLKAVDSHPGAAVIEEQIAAELCRRHAAGIMKDTLDGYPCLMVRDNCPLPRGSYFWEVLYLLVDGVVKTRTITVAHFQGRYSDWGEFQTEFPFDQ